MKNACLGVLIIGIVFGLVFVSGCTNSPGYNAPPKPDLRPPSISINTTPVQYAEVNGIHLGYSEFGSVDPLLLICGFGRTMDNLWNETFLGILASEYHVYIFDNRGMGYSSDNNATPAMSIYSDDAAALVQALGYSSMNVYGVSMGASISQQLVLDHPERVRKLILESVSYSIRIPETRLLFMLIQSSADNASAPPGTRREAEANLAWNGSYDRLSGINKSVMLAVGTEDILTPQNVTLQIASRIDGSWLVRFKGLPHTGSRYAPIEYGKTTLHFLGSNEFPPYSYQTSIPGMGYPNTVER